MSALNELTVKLTKSGEKITIESATVGELLHVALSVEDAANWLFSKLCQEEVEVTNEEAIEKARDEGYEAGNSERQKEDFDDGYDEGQKDKYKEILAGVESLEPEDEVELYNEIIKTIEACEP